MSNAKTPANIYIALAAIIQAIDAIPKDKNNEGQHFKFRGIDDCYNSLHKIFASNGVLCIPSVEKLETSDYMNAKGNKVFRSVVTVIYNFTAADGSSVASRVVGEAFDFGDKATNKAMSAAHKYLLLQTFLIPTRDIGDADSDNFNFDAGSAARQQIGSEYDGMTLAQLVELRTGIMNSGQVPPALLLGKIAEAKAAEEEADSALGHQKSAVATKTPEKAAESAPAPAKAAKEKKPKAEAPKQPELPVTTVEAEVIEQPERDGFEEEQTAPAKNPLDHVITAMKHKDCEGKKVGSLDAALVELAVMKWARNPANAATIAADPARQADAAALEYAYAQWEKQGAYKK